jgi:RNase P protein component
MENAVTRNQQQRQCMEAQTQKHELHMMNIASAGMRQS